MSDEILPEESSPEAEGLEREEFEEICSEEVDCVLEGLDSLMEKVQSENIRAYLEEASNGIYYLIYDDEDEDDSNDVVPEAA